MAECQRVKSRRVWPWMYTVLWSHQADGDITHTHIKHTHTHTHTHTHMHTHIPNTHTHTYSHSYSPPGQQHVVSYILDLSLLSQAWQLQLGSESGESASRI